MISIASLNRTNEVFTLKEDRKQFKLLSYDYNSIGVQYDKYQTEDRAINVSHGVKAKVNKKSSKKIGNILSSQNMNNYSISITQTKHSTILKNSISDYVIQEDLKTLAILDDKGF